MSAQQPTARQIESIAYMEHWLFSHSKAHEQLNAAIFGIANAMEVHPHDLAIYILLRTTSL